MTPQHIDRNKPINRNNKIKINPEWAKQIIQNTKQHKENEKTDRQK